MDVRHRLVTWCFIFQLLLLLIAEIEASKNIVEINLDLNDRVSKIEAKDRNQDGEIVLLKNALGEERKLVHDLTSHVAILEGSNKNSARNKRPYRLLPPNFPREPDENRTDADYESQFRFYGPATGCNDLGRLGYTLNGFYLVQEKENYSTNSITSNNKQIEIVECNFKHNPKLGNQNHHDNEKRLGFIRTSFGNNNFIPPFRSDIKEDSNSKEADNKERGLRLERINVGNNSNNIQTSRSNLKGNFDLKVAGDKEKGLKFTTIITKVTSSSPTQPRLDVRQHCLYKLKSEAHNHIPSIKHKNLCLVAAERKSKKNGSINTTNQPEYYLAQLPCDSVKDEEHWMIKNKHICSNKNDMCLTVSHNIKDGGLFLNFLAYKASAKSQQWATKEHPTYDIRRLVTVTNVGTSLCLFEPWDNNKGKRKANTTVKTCPTGYVHLKYLFYFEKVNLMNRKNCSPF